MWRNGQSDHSRSLPVVYDPLLLPHLFLPVRDSSCRDLSPDVTVPGEMGNPKVLFKESGLPQCPDQNSLSL